MTIAEQDDRKARHKASDLTKRGFMWLSIIRVFEGGEHIAYTVQVLVPLAKKKASRTLSSIH